MNIVDIFSKNLKKYRKSISIEEFQVHKNRNCFKFRFNIKNILKIINS